MRPWYKPMLIFIIAESSRRQAATAAKRQAATAAKRQAATVAKRQAAQAATAAKTQAALEARLKSSKSLLEKALKHGFVEPRTVVCLLIGVAGSGKTHTKHLLFKKNPPKNRTSTPIAERPVRAVIVCRTGEQFQEVNIDELDHILALIVCHA